MKKKILSILTVLAVGILVLSGFGVAAVTSSKATMDNHPPDAPFIDGEKGVIIGVEFDYYFNATDPDGDNVSYYIDWGDTNAEETAFHASGEEVAVSHTYSRMGAYTITAKAKDIHGAMGPEGTNPVEVPRSKRMTNPLILRLLERFIECFPLLEKLLNIQG